MVEMAEEVFAGSVEECCSVLSDLQQEMSPNICMPGAGVEKAHRLPKAYEDGRLRYICACRCGHRRTGRVWGEWVREEP